MTQYAIVYIGGDKPSSPFLDINGSLEFSELLQMPM